MTVNANVALEALGVDLRWHSTRPLYVAS